MSWDDDSHPSWLFPRAVADWLAEHGSLIDAVAVLRRDGADPEAIDLLLSFRPLLQLRLSWELWPDLGFEEGADPEELLAAVLPAELIALCRFALWGQEPPTGWTCLHAV